MCEPDPYDRAVFRMVRGHRAADLAEVSNPWPALALVAALCLAITIVTTALALAG